MRVGLRALALLALASMLAACAPRDRVVRASSLSWSSSTQLVLVTTPDWNASLGTLRRYERVGARWLAVGDPAAIAIGRAGSAWGLGLHEAQRGPQKREGDGRAPAGVFLLGDAFGYADRADTAMPYAGMQDSDYCVDVSGSPLYNRIVDTRDVGIDAVAGSTEPMRRDLHASGDPRYRLGLVIRHNDSGLANGGSCIFAHLWRTPGQSTAGCTAMDEATMQALLAWLRPERAPLFVLLPAPELARLQRDWHLPSAE
jgi:L,D-peptidoglycan transpeptidase YkuD (ErfK/YbiS/YcfS/YnhG family)